MGDHSKTYQQVDAKNTVDTHNSIIEHVANSATNAYGEMQDTENKGDRPMYRSMR